MSRVDNCKFSLFGMLVGSRGTVSAVSVLVMKGVEYSTQGVSKLAVAAFKFLELIRPVNVTSAKAAIVDVTAIAANKVSTPVVEIFALDVESVTAVAAVKRAGSAADVEITMVYA